MSVIRVDLNKCIGCRKCVIICPMDVFYFDDRARKSILAYPESCQNCGQCVVNCPGRSLGITADTFGYTMTAYRGATTAPMNCQVLSEPGVLNELTKGRLN